MDANTGWFKARMDDLQTTSKDFAQNKLKIHPTRWSRLTSGKLEWDLVTALDVCRHMKVSLEDLMLHGLRMDPAPYQSVLGGAAGQGAYRSEDIQVVREPSRLHEVQPAYAATAKVIGFVTDEGDVEAAETINLPVVACPAEKRYDALRLHSMGPFDGATFFLSDEAEPAGCLNQLCVTKVGSHQSLRIVRKGASPARFDLVHPKRSTDRISDVELSSVRPVSWVKLAG